MTAFSSSRRSPSAVSTPAPKPKARVYVVDDHQIIRNALAQLISLETDMEICGESATAERGFNEIAKLIPDVVIVDIALNGNSGLELIKSVRSLDPKIAIMVISMHSESFYGLRSLKAGARGYVTKQEAPFKVIEAIRQIRTGRIYASNELTAQVRDGIQNNATSGRDTPISGLSDRELEVLELIGDGNTTNEIAMRLHVSSKTIETHRSHIKEKLHLKNYAQLVQFCVRWVQEKEAQATAAG